MVVQMERGMPRRGKREVCPIRASYPKGLGEFTPLQACMAVQGAALARYTRCLQLVYLVC